MNKTYRLLATGAIIAAGFSVAPGQGSVVLASHSCDVNARISRLSNTSYKIGGTGSCNESVASLTLSCKPVHRHSTYWHSHSGTTFPASSNRSSISWDWGPLSGTNGDTYKSSCTGQFADHGSTVTRSDESFSINL